ncbi:conjugal transfer mating pair stabilization protein TraG [Aeromonas veronii]|nr:MULTISPECIES: conjugal transfer mating-pair stabilization protein TraG [Aeromonas]NJI19848.1 conjugal transfer mating pair stabilization protein TraG [Aeromonas veronii]WIW80884.1 traG [Aeromonas salmonicida subsp. salmonicida]
MDAIYVTTGGGLFRDSLNAVAAFTMSSNWSAMLYMATVISILVAAVAYIRTHDLTTMLKWVVAFVMVSGVLLGVKRPVQVIDISDPAGIYQVDNVPVGLVLPASLISTIGHGVVVAYETVFHRPDALTYSKTGMLFGASLVGGSTDFASTDPIIASLFSDYVQNCVVGDMMLNHKYSLEELMRSEDPYALIFSRPSPLRGVYDQNSNFQTCQWAALQLQTALNVDTNPGGNTWTYYVRKLFGGRPSSTALFGTMMGDSYSYFYGGSQGASEIMKRNVTLNALRKGIVSYSARSGDTASLVNLSAESSFAKLRMSQATGASIATKTLPTMQTILFGIQIGLFPIIMLLAITSLLTVDVLKNYVFTIAYLQTWPILFAILNNAMNFYLKETTQGFNVTLSSLSQVQQQFSDIGTTAGWLALSIPFLAYGIVKGMGSAVSQAGSYLGNALQSASTQSASQAVDGTWAFNNMQTDNVTGGKWDTNSSYANGQMTAQTNNGSLITQTAGGGSVYNSAPAMSKLPVDINFGKAMSSTAQRLARESETQAESSLAGYNHAVNSAFNQAKQFSSQSGNSSTLTSGTDSSQATTQSQGANMMLSAAQSYAQRNNISESQAFNELMDKATRGEVNAGAKAYGRIDSDKAIVGKVASLAFGASGGAEVHAGASASASSGSTDSTNQGSSQSRDHSSDQSSQEVKDFRQGKDMVQSYRSSVSGSHTDNTANTMLEQLGTTLSVADSQYNQYTASLTRSHEYSQMASTSDTTSANMQSNYAQEFTHYVQQQAPEKADQLLTDTASPTVRAEREQLAGQFMENTLRSRVEGMYEQKVSGLSDGMSTVEKPSSSNTPPANGEVQINQRAQQSGITGDTSERVNSLIGDNNQRIHDERVSIGKQSNVIINEQEELKSAQASASDKFKDNHSAAVIQQGQEDPRVTEAKRLASEHSDKEIK